MRKAQLLLILISVSFMSCKEAIEELNSVGKFTSTITGSVDKEFNGQAVFVHGMITSSTPQTSSLVIVLSQDANSDEVITLSLTKEGATGIAKGTYLYDISGTGTLFIPSYTNGNGLYSIPVPAEANTITITDVQDLIIKGNFEINLMDVTTNNTVKIAGTFDALGKTETN
ncbi:MAG: hypothetical protein L3J29_07825 [Cyclobacteriaceae bacterium]|nr:hypothetical protein [Cyclobacteriaceae bacterium]